LHSLTRGSSVLLVIGVLIVGGVTSCTLKQLRSVTYPPDFQYITREEIQTTMGRLAVQIVALNDIMGREGGPGPSDQTRVVEILETMKGLAAELKSARRSSHPRIDSAAPLLQEAIGRALRGVQSNPPNYYFAGEASGSCTYCHPSPLASVTPRKGRRP
jgi:hypothetical protein